MEDKIDGVKDSFHEGPEHVKKSKAIPVTGLGGL
jgi:hypothetical protein